MRVSTKQSDSLRPPFTSAVSGGGTGRTLHPDNVAVALRLTA
ncbi:GGGtGRT protein [Vibrio chagasii]|nr:GGGtGRT protein [Vibrio chagasii]